MAIRPKDRFEAFKRDAFTCQYCGRKPPAVVLEADHVIPRAEGGGDGLDNLITACEECNIGKGARTLDDRAPSPDLLAQRERIAEREEQLRAYHEVQAAALEKRLELYDSVRDHWFEVWGETDLQRWHMPWENYLRSAIDKLGPAEVMDAMDVTAGRFGYVTTKAVRYFGGILKWRLAAAEGRIVRCTYCDREMALTPAEAAQGLVGWYHTGCKPEQEAET